MAVRSHERRPALVLHRRPTPHRVADRRDARTPEGYRIGTPSTAAAVRCTDRTSLTSRSSAASSINIETLINLLSHKPQVTCCALNRRSQTADFCRSKLTPTKTPTPRKTRAQRGTFGHQFTLEI